MYLSKVPDHKIKAEAMLQMVRNTSSANFLVVEHGLKKRLTEMADRGMKEHQDGSYWEEKWSINLPFKCNETHYDENGNQISEPKWTSMGPLYTLAVVWLKKKINCSPSPTCESGSWFD